jgi:hypothetical protein
MLELWKHKWSEDDMRWESRKIARELFDMGYTSSDEDYWEMVNSFDFTENQALIFSFLIGQIERSVSL